jgi:hypothetical protein
MPTLKIVVDEWLWADLDCENDDSAQTEAVKFLSRVLERCDKLVTVERSPFLRKFFDFTKRALRPEARKIVKLFKYNFFYNSDKLLRLPDDKLPNLAPEIAGKVKHDDQYLVQAYLVAEADVVVTTDAQLLRALADCGFKGEHRDSFLPGFRD